MGGCGAGGAAGGGHRLGRLDRAQVVPADLRRGHRRRAGTADRGPARRARHPADLRRHGPGPLLHPGVRACAGPVLRDGLPPPRGGRSAVRAGRARRSRLRCLRPLAGVVRGGEPGAGRARRDVALVPGGLCRRGQRLPRGSYVQRAVARVRRTRDHRPRLRARALDAHRLAGLVEGAGMGPAQQHGRRDHPGAVRHHRDSERGGGAVPRLPGRRAPADPRPGCHRVGPLRPRGPAVVRGGPAAAARARGPARGGTAAAVRGPYARGDPAAAGHR